jgi:hypothetical protein
MGRQLAGSNTALVYTLRSVLSQLILFLFRFCSESDKDQIRTAYPRDFQPQSVYSASRYPVKFPIFVSACDSQKQPKLARKL